MKGLLFVGAAVIVVAWLIMSMVRRFGWLDVIVFSSIGALMVFLILCAVAVLSKREARHG